MVNNILTVDGHIHTFADRETAHKILESFNRMYEINYENPGNGTIDQIVKMNREDNIDFFVTANFAPPKILHENNLWNLKCASENKCLIPLVSFHPEMMPIIETAFFTYLKSGAKGVKLHPMAQNINAGDKNLECVYELCTNTGLPVVIHCGRVANARLNEYSDLEYLIPVINKYPKVRFVLTHMADGNITDLEMLSKSYENVYFDTSIVFTGYPLLREFNEASWKNDHNFYKALEYAGANRIIFGSDFPWGSPVHDINRILNLDISYQEKQLILGLNSIKLFNILLPSTASIHSI